MVYSVIVDTKGKRETDSEWTRERDRVFVFLTLGVNEWRHEVPLTTSRL